MNKVKTLTPEQILNKYVSNYDLEVLGFRQSGQETVKRLLNTYYLNLFMELIEASKLSNEEHMLPTCRKAQEKYRTNLTDNLKNKLGVSDG